jgi:hypothetical protein
LFNCRSQIGLGNNVTIDTITVPTEIVLWRGSSAVGTKCLDICAGMIMRGVHLVLTDIASPGGDLACFTVERSDDSSSPQTVDLLLCGNGQWGGLGNNSYSTAQGLPVRARNVSGILECEELVYFSQCT